MGRVATQLMRAARRDTAIRCALAIPLLIIACLGGVGCLNRRAKPLDIPVPEPSESPVQNPLPRLSPPSDANLSGALDGPTLRLALRDLAVILDTLGRLEQVRPDLKSQMLRELADADAVTAASVVKRWRARLPELQAAAEEHVRTEATEPASMNRAATSSALQAENGSATASKQPHEKTEMLVTSIARTTGEASPIGQAKSPELLPNPILADPANDEDSPELPSWDDLLESLLGLTRERVEELGPDATRARIQLALLELVRRSQESGADAATPDPQLWNHLNPAIHYCFGTEQAGQPSAQEAVRSLQVATELLRGPGRFQLRGLAFCTRIRGFGNIDRVDSAAFAPGQTVLLYSEVEHFFSEPEPGGFRTRISSVVELLDANGCIAWSQDFGTVEDTSNGPRRDYFLSYRFRLPQQVKPGVYAIRLTLCDELANRSASGAIALSIR